MPTNYLEQIDRRVADRRKRDQRWRDWLSKKEALIGAVRRGMPQGVSFVSDGASATLAGELRTAEATLAVADVRDLARELGIEVDLPDWRYE